MKQFYKKKIHLSIRIHNYLWYLGPKTLPARIEKKIMIIFLFAYSPLLVTLHVKI